jgi:D-alanyl-D-alanine carboxypeptidase
MRHQTRPQNAERPASSALLALCLACSACASQRATTPAHGAATQAAVSHPSAGGASNPQRAELEALLEALRARGNLPALGAAVIGERGLIAMGAVGVRRLGGETIRVDDRWQLGANAATMTATLVARLVAEELMSWDMRIADIVSEDINPDYADVSLSELMQHRGGLPANLPDDLWDALTESGDPEKQRQFAVARMLERPQSSPTGSFAYSNAGYLVVAALIEQLANESWENLLEKRIFVPLQMASCGLGAPPEPWGHRLNETHATLEPLAPGSTSDNPPALAPAGNVHCSLEDWAKFVGLHLRALRGQPNLLSSRGFTAMHAPPAGQDYAMGFSVVERDWAKGRALTNTGSGSSFYSSVWIAPQINRAYLVTTNRGDAFDIVNETISELIEHYPGQ